MATADRRLERRALELEQDGADPLRLRALERARRFKRSWVEMAEVLLAVREQNAWAAWDYKDLYQYCAEELLLKRKTVDKLTGSYVTLKRHAPEALRSEEATVPTIDAVDYFNRAIDGAEQAPPETVVDDLKKAVFDELEPVGTLRKRFNPVLYANDAQDDGLRRIERASAAARRLRDQLDRVEGLSPARLAQSVAALEALVQELERLITDRSADGLARPARTA